ncbi:hypothetical protein H4S08_003332 [Coemansia sp. RSA 1365]|nr:hypothetical protein H4S08_003332 [Coemansia sp. RSA 1365]
MCALFTQCRTIEERECRRRLVQFWRRHENNSITCTFKAVSAADRVPNSTVVSCIFWEEKQDFFITSVDCIHLLESLIAVRFTVEEKNRIRRNLEGFRPLTVSKCKAESADFFKLIMSFPNPKPRNIEKDVKVFPWRILPLALKKIIGKYTASYSNPSGVSLDALTATKASSSSQLAGVPLSAPAGGMMAFSPNVPSALTSTSTITAVMAAATSNSASPSMRRNSFGTTFTAAGAQTPMPSTAPGSASELSSTTSLAAILEAQEACNRTKIESNSCDISSTHMACPQSDAGMCLNLDFGMGIDGNSLDTVGTSASVVGPTSLNSNPLLGLGQLVPSAAHKKNVNAFTPLLLQDQTQSQNCSSTFKQEDNQQPYLAGMAFNPSLQLSTCATAAQHDGTTAQFANGHIFEQLAGYDISSLDCGSQMADTKDDHETFGHISSSQSQLQSQLQLAVRGSSTKRSTPYMPYNIDRAERIKPASASSDCGFKTMAQNDALSRVSTSLSSTCENLSVRAVSPSIPLIMQQQATSSAAEAASFNSFLDLDAAAGPSSTPTALLHSIITSTEPPTVDSYTSFAASTEDFISSKAASVPFHEMLGKTFYNPPQPHVLHVGSNLQAHDIHNANIPGPPIDSAIASDDYTFLADLIRVSAGHATANHTSASPGNGTAYSTSTEIKDSESSTATTEADTCSDHESTENPSVSVGGLVEEIFSPNIALAKLTPQYTAGIKADQTSSSGDASAHRLDSSLIFNTMLFGGAKPSHGF